MSANSNTSIFVAMAAAATIASVTHAQSLNIDLSTTAGATPGPAPASAYGAASGQLGFWNNITSATASNVALNNLGGTASGVTLSLDGGTMLGLNNSTPNGMATTAGSNAELLLDDIWDPGLGVLAGTITINNLAAGIYDIYTYAVAPDSGTASTTVTVPGAVQGMQTVTGTLPNPFNDAYALGLTHSLHSITLAATGTVTIQIGVGATFASVGGLQIVTIPGPGAAALLGLACLMSGPRRRRH